ncbi:MAG TPA: phosphoethanolamine--lipid A transferase [Methyloversatilis sp.]
MRKPERSTDSAGWHPTRLLLILAIWLISAGNLPLWQALWRLPETGGARGWIGALAYGVLALALLVPLLCLTVWPRWLKPAGVLLMTISTASSYFMLSYGVVIDPTMIANVFNTDAREVRDLLSWHMPGALLVGVVLPGIWWWRVPVRRIGTRTLLAHQLGVAALACLLGAGTVWLAFQDIASIMRNHKELRYMTNPLNSLYAVARVTLGSTQRAAAAAQSVGSDAQVARANRPDADAAPLIVVVVGETARAANFSLGGYARDTNPELAALQATGDLVYFNNVRACGTNTHASLPCMFSHLGKAAFEASRQRQENLLDVLQHAGLAVLWVDNQSGCKGLCDNVPHVFTRTLDVPGLCPDGECYDEVMLHGLDERLAALDPAQRARGVVVVMHQMGSHGPAYYRRSPPAFKPFLPECTSSALQECPHDQLVNAYDNTLRYTDHVLAETVKWLQAKAQPTAMIYVSDHGESLGESGLYLHGMPYAMAPDEQTRVPMVVWLSAAMQHAGGLTPACLRGEAAKPWSHDNLFHSVLGLAGVQTAVYRRPLDLFAACLPDAH